MRHVQIDRRHRAARSLRPQDGEETLSLDPRDPDIVRAKQLLRMSASSAPGAGR